MRCARSSDGPPIHARCSLRLVRALALPFPIGFLWALCSSTRHTLFVPSLSVLCTSRCAVLCAHNLSPRYVLSWHRPASTARVLLLMKQLGKLY